MACFIVPGSEGIVSAVLTKLFKGRVNGAKIAQRFSWLTKLSFGGAFLLAFEHLWHGEISVMPPFLTAMNSAENTAVMLDEMATVGVSMSLAITIVWLIMCFVAEKIENRQVAKA
ncbi:hypothetical protein FMM54_05250 [Campylobacter sp. LR185c]|uniref:hypothetical protein n=1 Tax=Campylobacter sp. LR185c TaxID=2014525 RepID=UPI001237A05A|nr:hypothetical protein [Campylobacter sp. LR185c]KAA6226198.1 hypothetical protein FMM54_05250 [Campylobacter sp. LR185c]KAA8604695.1 hypothetical protein CGP82_01885 [Campylobacter sp. LR185c]